ncbi:hypothetical protein ACFQJC_09700 [Haloferax namakaokahaiae]|uniref:Tat (Twin-arginine translocation) pathway signal sequence n=1 Tax=Haloferax namakaokahaiae TaxID=1748331 RepID=A0ABD5ZES2_9EURY
MNEHDADLRRWPHSRRAFLRSVGVAVGGIGLTSGTAVGQSERPPDQFTLDIDNRYFPLPVGRRLLLEGDEEGVTVKLRVTVLDETENLGDVTTRVVEEREWEDGALLEVSRNYFAQSTEGDVWYFGEAVDIYEDGAVVSNEGSWRAYEDGNEPGVFMPATPEVGMLYRQERAPGVAEDKVLILGLDETVEVPAGTFENTLRTYDWNPLEPGTPGDVKVYAPSVGIIVDGAVELVEFVE